jgi:small-conductance mechanosensitive channel
VIQWLVGNWLDVVIPLIAFLATLVVGLWLRRLVSHSFERWGQRTKWEGTAFVIHVLRQQILYWILLLGAIIALDVSVLPTEAKSLAGRIIGSLFTASIAWALILTAEHFLKQYLERMKAAGRVTTVILNVIRIAVIIVAALVVLDIWGGPTTPIILLIVIAVLAAALALRSEVPDFFAGLRINATQNIKVNDYIRLETGEEGSVVEITWNSTRLRVLDGSILTIPNSRLIQRAVTNYGRPLKKAKEIFRFFSQSHLTELTGLKATNLKELVDTLRNAPDEIVHYHTHNFLVEHHYLAPEPANDFAVWVTDALGDEVLGERLASVDTFEFPKLGALRERLVGIIDEYLSTGDSSRAAMPGREFYFMKSVSAVFATTYVASDLREFVEALRKISLSSLYYHVFESRLRLGAGHNDFSEWFSDSLDEAELAQEIARLDPYTYTLEGLRSRLIQLIEKRIK